jgi:hypothetical protein
VIAADVVGTVAALCSMTSFAPQIAKIWRDRDASEISLSMYLVTVERLWPLDRKLAGDGVQPDLPGDVGRGPGAEMALQPGALIQVL